MDGELPQVQVVGRCAKYAKLGSPVGDETKTMSRHRWLGVPECRFELSLMFGWLENIVSAVPDQVIFHRDVWQS